MANTKSEKLFTEFPPVPTEKWEEVITADLKGADYERKLVWKTGEGFNVRPYYRAENLEGIKFLGSQAGEFPYVRGTHAHNRWRVHQTVSVVCPKEANAEALKILNAGVDSLGFCIASADFSAADLDMLLKDICIPAVEITFCGEKTAHVAELVLAKVEKEGIAKEDVRIAFCIECHKYTPVLQELCRQLQHPEADIFIHVDAKSDIGDFAPLRPLARFIHPRSKVYWGEYGQIDCMLKLLRATCNGDYRYIAILSGDTLPLRPCGQIHDFLEACYPRQFADMQPELHITELTQKMQWCHYPDRNDWIGRLPGYFRKRLYKRLRPGDNPYFRTLPPLEKGSNWIVVTDRFRDFVFDYLRTHPDYIRAFRHSHCGDEIFFQTLMGISEFAGANTRRPLVYTRWVGEGAPHPETFGTDDLSRLLQARDTAAEVPYLFARKIADDLDIARYRETLLR